MTRHSELGNGHPTNSNTTFFDFHILSAGGPLYVSLRSALQVGWLNSVRFPQQPLCIPCTQANRLQTGHSTVQSWCLSSKPPKLKNLDWHFLMHYPGFFSTACCLSLEALFAQSFTQGVWHVRWLSWRWCFEMFFWCSLSGSFWISCMSMLCRFVRGGVCG